MRMLARGAIGLALTLGALLLAVTAGLSLREAREQRAAVAPRAPAERVYTVAVATLERVTATPEIAAYGQLRAWRTAQVSAPVGGRIAWLSPDWRDGARVRAGAEIARIDPADYSARVEDAEVALEEARADAAEARQSVRSAQVELDAARTQRDLRAASLERQKMLAGRGVASAAVVDDAELALSAAAQAAASREQALLTAELRIGRADLAVRRAGLTLAEAERRLAETVVRAPFDGLVTAAAAAVGDMAQANQPLGALIDPAALEAALRVSGPEFGRLLDAGGALIAAPVTIRLELGARVKEVTGALDRADATAGDGAGRLVFARLDVGADTALRSGDFVAARIAEPALSGVAVAPAAAVSEDGRILIVGPDDRLQEVVVSVLRREGDRVILADAPIGAVYVAARSPQLGPGLRVRPVGEGPAISAASERQG